MIHYRRLLITLFVCFLNIMIVTGSSASTPIQTQYGPDGLEVDLKSIKCSDKYVTTIFEFRATGNDWASITYDHSAVNFVDEAGAKNTMFLKIPRECIWQLMDTKQIIDQLFL